MKRLILTALLIVTANTVAATNLSIKHNKKLPTPYELITKGKILAERMTDRHHMVYWIAWDKTDDIYVCALNGKVSDGKNAFIATCHLALQNTQPFPE